MRLYVWEQAAWFPGNETTVHIAPLPYLRTGPGRALDGGPKFDVTKYNPAYFSRLRERVQAAGAHGIYVSVMLFDGWSIELKEQKTGNPWRGHPFNRANNVNGIDGDPDGDGQGKEIHTLRNPSVTALQKAYLAKVVETVGDLDNVLWEISNESPPEAVEWEYEMIRTVHALEAARGTPHPVGMTSVWPYRHDGNASLFHSPADWVAPYDNAADPYKQDPPPSTSRDKLVMSDTDHLWGVGGGPRWVWKSFFRGLNPLFMDPYETRLRNKLPIWPVNACGGPGPLTSPVPEWEDVRLTMGYARALAEHVDLTALRPMGALASSGYCLAAPGREYLAYLTPKLGRIRLRLLARLGPLLHQRVALDLSAAAGLMDVEWVNPRSGLVFAASPVQARPRLVLRAPFAGDAIVHLWHATTTGVRSPASPQPGAARDAGRRRNS
jgi:hypothetical protein